jgi:hypothetical protein
VDREEKKAGTHRDVGTGIHTQKDRIIKLIMKASNDGHNRLRLGRWKEGSLLHLHSEKEREIGKKKRVSCSNFPKKLFLSFLNKMEKKERKRGRKNFVKKIS